MCALETDGSVQPSKRSMPLDPKRLDKPFTKLRKLVRKISKTPTQGEVHDIRTNTRRAEAILEALQLDQKRKGRRVLQAVTPMRKKAGDVRDMDVLTGFAATLSSDADGDCLVKLLEHLGEERARGARKLRKTVAKRRKKASTRLKACSALIEKKLDKRRSGKQREWPMDSAAAALRISGELSSWPTLSAKNLHPFRLKVKEMRYVLQLSGEDSELSDRLGAVKDQIGEWHDWTELNAIAKEILSDCRNCEVIARIDQTAKKKFKTAMQRAQQLRRNYFQGKSRPQQRGASKIAIKEPVLKAAAKLAA